MLSYVSIMILYWWKLDFSKTAQSMAFIENNEYQVSFVLNLLLISSRKTQKEISVISFQILHFPIISVSSFTEMHLMFFCQGLGNSYCNPPTPKIRSYKTKQAS